MLAVGASQQLTTPANSPLPPTAKFNLYSKQQSWNSATPSISQYLRTLWLNKTFTRCFSKFNINWKTITLPFTKFYVTHWVSNTHYRSVWPNNYLADFLKKICHSEYAVIINTLIGPLRVSHGNDLHLHYLNETWDWFKLVSSEQTNCFTVWKYCCKRCWCG